MSFCSLLLASHPVASLYNWLLLGNLRNISASLSIGAAMRPMTVSNGGFSPALGWLRVGTNCFVLANEVARDSLSWACVLSACSSAGRSRFSSSSMCFSNKPQISFSLGMYSGSWDFRF